MARILLNVIFLLIVVTCVSAQLPSRPSPGILTGLVVDTDTQKPLTGVHVGSMATGFVTTDSNGRYTLQAPPGSYTIRIQEGASLSGSLTMPKNVTVNNSASTFLDFSVRIEAKLLGRILDENGDPITGLRVVLISRSYSGEGSTLFGKAGLVYQERGQAVTNDLGQYTFTAPAGRDYWILAMGSRRNEKAISEAPADPGARAPVFASTYYPSSDSIDNAMSVRLHSLEERGGMDIRMRRATSLCIEATLLAQGLPSEFQYIISDETNGPILQNSSLSTGQSGKDGNIRVCDLYKGKFLIVAVAPVPSPNNTRPSREYIGVESVTVSDIDVKGIRVTALPLIKVSGEVVWEGMPPNLTQPIQLRINVPRGTGGVLTTIPGSFLLALEPTLSIPYELNLALVAASGQLQKPIYIRDALYDGSSLLRQEFAPSPGGQLRVIIGQDGGSVTVTVLGENLSPRKDALVLVVPSDVRSNAELAHRLVSGTADGDGRFTAKNLRPGDYYVIATEDLPPGKSFSAGYRLDKSPENLDLVLRLTSGVDRVRVAPLSDSQVTVKIKSLTNK